MTHTNFDGRFSTAVRQANYSDDYIAFGKPGEFKTDPEGRLFSVMEPAPLFFAFGATPDQAIASVLKEMGAAQ